MSHELQPLESVAAIDAHGAQVQSMFSDIARGYDRANRWMSFGTDVRWRRRAVAGMLPAGRSADGARLLDLCAGTLDSTLEIHHQYPRADIVAGDFSAGMLAHGRTKLQGEAAARIATQEMDAHALPLPDAGFDALFCAFGVRNLSDLPAATAEQRRVLRPGGRLTVLEFFRPTALLTRAVHALHNRTLLPLIGWAATGNLGAYLYLPRSIGKFATVDAYCDLLRACGFVDVTAERLTLGIAWVVRATRPEAA
jgi:demethylmenaquinone methyltransferase / 2-methoxy-6-polyprenyl-1,4-benzoquinol methylase